MDQETIQYLLILFEKIQEESHDHNPGIETTKDFVAGIEVEAALRHELTSSQVNSNLFTQANTT